MGEAEEGVSTIYTIIFENLRKNIKNSTKIDFYITQQMGLYSLFHPLNKPSCDRLLEGYIIGKSRWSEGCS